MTQSVSEATLYERLGRRPGIEKIVEVIWANHTSNPFIKQRYVNSDPANVKRLVTEMCCAGFGGPANMTTDGRFKARSQGNSNFDQRGGLSVKSTELLNRVTHLFVSGGEIRKSIDDLLICSRQFFLWWLRM